MLVTLFGIAIDVSEEHPQNAHCPILVTRFGIVTDVSEEQFLNALFPIFVTGSSVPL
jgi:hypothetical protein